MCSDILDIDALEKASQSEKKTPTKKNDPVERLFGDDNSTGVRDISFLLRFVPRTELNIHTYICIYDIYIFRPSLSFLIQNAPAAINKAANDDSTLEDIQKYISQHSSAKKKGLFD